MVSGIDNLRATKLHLVNHCIVDVAEEMVLSVGQFSLETIVGNIIRIHTQGNPVARPYPHGHIVKMAFVYVARRFGKEFCAETPVPING